MEELLICFSFRHDSCWFGLLGGVVNTLRLCVLMWNNLSSGKVINYLQMPDNLQCSNFTN